MKKTAKQSIDKLRAAFAQYQKVSSDQFPKLRDEINNHIFALFNIINSSDSSKIREIEKINEMIYRDSIIKEMLAIMSVCNQSNLNSISGFFQTSLLKFPNTSLATYFIKHPEDFNHFMLLFDNLEVGSTAHIIFRACLMRSRLFAEFLFKNGYAISFFQFLVDDNFDKLGPAFASFDILLNSYIDLSLEHITKNWILFHYQFKILLFSNNYIVLSYFLAILYRFLSHHDAKNLMLKFIDDPDNLIMIMNLLKSKKRRLSVGAYYLFKLFVLNARRSKYVFAVFKQNQNNLITFLNHFVLPDIPTIQDQIDEDHQLVINELKKM